MPPAAGGPATVAPVTAFPSQAPGAEARGPTVGVADNSMSGNANGNGAALDSVERPAI